MCLKFSRQRTSHLDLAMASGEHFTVLVPRVRSGTKEGTRTLFIRTHEIEANAFEFEAIRGCPRNCERRALDPNRPLGNWEGRISKVTTREPGDLPAQSPNRWTGCPYGAVFRSGDGNAGATAVRAKSPTTFRKSSRRHAARFICVLRNGLGLHPKRPHACGAQTKGGCLGGGAACQTGWRRGGARCNYFGRARADRSAGD